MFGAAVSIAVSMLVWGGSTAATAQDSSRNILGLGNAVVTGFSGVRPPAVPLPPRIDPIEKTFIDLDRPSARVINLDALRGPPRAQVVQASKPFSATAAQVGQVFSVALDDATPPNIYLAATTAYGLPIVVPDRDGDGRPDRSRRGGPNASFMPGLFGPVTVDGGPGSIWKVDGRTGAVTLFANVTLDKAPNSGPALGGLAFDRSSRQLFVSDRDTGMIHRFGLDGADRGRFDHGVNGRPAAGLSAFPFDPRKRLDLTSPAFDSGNPASWAYAPPPRRVFGLAVRGGRLFYAVAADLQIWSVSIAQNGGFGSDPRLELNVPRGQSVAEISNIVFDEDGRMILAERGAPTGAYDYRALAESGENRVLRFRPKRPGDPPSPGFWYPVPDEYAIGFPPDFRNDNGGLAIGYGYDASGSINRTACGGTLWSTGEQLRNARDRALIQRLQPGGPLIVGGLQGNAIRLVRPQNEPPFESYSIDYDDRFDDAGARGHLGDVEIWRVCGQAGLPPSLSPPLVPVLVCPPGWLNVAGVCLAGLACPRGTEFADGRCVYPGCPRSYVRIRGQCVPPPLNCKSDETYANNIGPGRCELPTCPPGLVVTKMTDASPELVATNGTKTNGELTPIPPTTPPGAGGGKIGGDYCKCPIGSEPGKHGTCVATPPPTVVCPAPLIPQFDGLCCEPNDDIGATCVPPPPPTTIVIDCTGGKVFRDNACVCPSGYEEDVPGGTCVKRSPITDVSCPGSTQVCRGVAPNIICECYTPPSPPEPPPPPSIVCKATEYRACCTASGDACVETATGACPSSRPIEACRTPPPDQPGASLFCSTEPFKLVNGTCCLGGATCTAKPLNGACGAAEYDTTGWGDTPMCCREAPIGTCPPPPPSRVVIPPPPPDTGGINLCDNPLFSMLCRIAGACYADVDCPVGNACVDGECKEQLLQPSAAPATGTCQPPSIQVGGTCCTPEAVAAGTCGAQAPPPAAGACKAGLYPSNDGKTCCTKEEITRETCGNPPPAAAKKAQKAKTVPPVKKKTTVPAKKPETVCRKGFHREGDRCVADSQPQPRADPGFSIQFGIGVGGGGRPGGGGGRPGGGGARPGHGTPN